MAWLRWLVWLLVVIPAWLIWEALRAPEVPARRDGDKPWET